MKSKKKLFLIISLIIPFVILYHNLTMVSEKPNIILIHIETGRADHFSCYGYHRNTTPNICNVARDGVLFKNAYAQGGSTYISIPSLYFSLYPPCHGIHSWFGEINQTAYLFPILENKGYKTDFLTNFIPKNGWERIGFDADKLDSTEILSKIKGIPEEESTFMGIHYNGCHRPYFTPGDKLNYFDEGIEINRSFAYKFHTAHIVTKRKILSNITDDERDKLFKFLINRFDEKLKKTDIYMGKILDILKKRKMYNNSLIIITADHGEELIEEERERYFQNGGVYNELTHIPLIIKFPQNEYSGTEISQLVRHIDILPTLLDYLDIKSEKLLQGTSLLPAIKGKNLSLDVYSNSRAIHSLRSKKYNYIYIEVNKTINLMYRHLEELSNENENIRELLNVKYNSSEEEFKSSIKEKFKNVTNEKLYKVNEDGDEITLIKNTSLKNKFKTRIFKILTSCPPSSPKPTDSKGMDGNLRKKLMNLGYLPG